MKRLPAAYFPQILVYIKEPFPTAGAVLFAYSGCLSAQTVTRPVFRPVRIFRGMLPAFLLLPESLQGIMNP